MDDLKPWNFAFQFPKIRELFVNEWMFEKVDLEEWIRLNIAHSTLSCFEPRKGKVVYRCAAKDGFELQSMEKVSSFNWWCISKETMIYKVMRFCSDNRTRYEILKEYLQRNGNVTLFQALWQVEKPTHSCIPDNELELLKILMIHPDFTSDKKFGFESAMKKGLLSLKIGHERAKEALMYPVPGLDNYCGLASFNKYRILQYGMENLTSIKEISQLFYPNQVDFMKLVSTIRDERDRINQRHFISAEPPCSRKERLKTL